MGNKYAGFKSHREFRLAIESMQIELYSAAINYGLYRYLVEMRQKYQREFYRTRFLWGLAQDALLSQAILTLCRIYDGNDATNSLEMLLKRIQNSDNLGTEIDDLARDIRLVSKSDSMVRKLRDWRNNVLAHTNLDRVIGKKKPPPNMVPTHEELLPLIDRAMDILSRHGGGFVSRSLSEHSIPRQEVDFVFDSVKEKLTLIEAGIRERLAGCGVNPDVFLDEKKGEDEIFGKNNLL